MKDPYLDSVLELLASEALRTEGRHLISVDELRAAGALDVPPSWRKSLGAERKQYPLFADDEMFADDHPPTPVDEVDAVDTDDAVNADDDESADELD